MNYIKLAIANILFIVLSIDSSQCFGQIASEIPTTYNVTPGGAFQYSLPLRLPPGIKDLVPNLSISYSSQGGNGLLGLGWSLNGLSVITRGNADLYHDYSLKPATFNNDVLLLDGQRLEYDATTSKYMTEVKNFADIEAYNGGFKVVYPSGLIYEYGTTTNTRILGMQRSDVLMWALTKIEDQHGNYVEFEYVNDHTFMGYNYLTKIRYGLNGNTTDDIPVEIDFNYSLRSDMNSTWVSGSILIAYHRLSNIVVKFSNNTEANKYIFTYDGTTSYYSKLIKIEEKRNGTTTLPPIDINWGTASPSYQATNVTSSSNTSTVNSIGDYNGDGYMDFIEKHNSSCYVYFNNGTGNFTQVSGANVPVMTDGFSTWGPKYYRRGAPYFRSNAQFDYNGDGMDDIIVINMYNKGTYFNVNTLSYFIVSTPYYEVWLYKANGNPATVFDAGVMLYSKVTIGANTKNDNFNALTHIQAGDFDGDGRGELFIAHPYNFNNLNSVADYEFIVVGENFSNGHKVYHFSQGHIDGALVLDYNGDGKDEISFMHQFGPPLGDRSLTYQLDVSYNSSFTPVLNQTSTTWPITLVSNSPTPQTWARNWRGDFNGDGLDDILVWNTSLSRWELHYSNGAYDTYSNGFTGISYYSSNSGWPLSGLSSTGPTTTIGYSVHVADFNGDGMDDILQLEYNSSTSTTEYDIYYSKSITNFSHESGTFDGFPSYLENFVADFNGDGQADIFSKTLSFSKLVSFYPNNQSLKVTSIDHAGKTLQIGYQYLTRDADYQGVSAPNNDYSAKVFPLNVVKILSDNVSMYNTYKYRGLLNHKYGLGFRGFTEFEQTNVGGQKVYQTYNLTSRFPYLKELQVYDGNGTMAFGKRTYYNQIDINGGASGKSRIVVNYDSITVDNINAAIIKKSINPGACTTGTVFYEYGRMASTETRQNDLHDNNDSYSSVVYDYGSSWIANKGNPEKETAYSEIDPSGLNGITKETAYTYNAYGDLATLTTDNGKPHAKTVTYTYDNVYGNLVQKDVAAGSLPTLTDKYFYSDDGKFMIKEKDPENYEITYDYGIQPLVACWGNVLEIKDKQQLIKNYEYDDINRTTKVIDRSHKEKNGVNDLTYTTTYGSAILSFWATGLTNARYIALTTNNDNGSFSGVVTDIYGRTIRTLSPDHNGSPIKEDIEYNSIGLVSMKTYPYTFGKVETAITYDGFNRQIQSSVITPGFGLTVNTDYNYNAGLLYTTVTNAGTWKSRTTVSCGSTIRQIYGGTDNLEYTYHGNGEYAKVTSNGSVMENKLDMYGRLYQNIQPNVGTFTYEYDALDRITKEYKASMVTYEYSYDNIGRMISKLEVGQSIPYQYVYAPAGTGVGLDGLLMEEKVPNVAGATPATFSTKYFYNTSGDLIKKEENSAFPNVTFHPHNLGKNETLYSRYPNGKLKEYTFYNDISVEYTYNGAGNVNLAETHAIPNGANHKLWEIWGRDVFGNLTGAYVYNKTSTGVLYSVSQGFNGIAQPTGLQVGNHNGPVMTIIDREYGFNTITGNMDYRADKMKTPTITENFTYDTEYDRLTKVQYLNTALPTPPTPPLTDLDMEYAPNGNILKKSDVTVSPYNWKYNDYALGTVPEPATSAVPYEIPTNTLYTDYYPSGKVSRVFEQGQNEVVFTYGPGDERIKAEYYDASITPATLLKTKYYGENYEMILDKTGKVTELFYVWEGKDLVAIIRVESPAGAISYSTSTSATFYPIRDHLGSIIYFLDEDGNRLTNNGIVEERSFDAWGRLRDPNTYVPYRSGNYPSNWICDRGYTGQEHIGLGTWSNNIVNLNGRLYDPLVGRMFSPDPLIASEANSQDYNKYSYARNNPLVYIDPSGHEPITIIAMIAFSAFSTLAANASNIESFGGALLYFGIGAAAGAVGAGVGAAVSPLVTTGGFVGGAVVGGSSGLASGFVSGAGTAWAGGASFGDGLSTGAKSGAIGAGTGALLGGLDNGITATKNEGKFWNGDPKTYKITENGATGSSSGYTLKNTSGKTVYYKPEADGNGLSTKSAYPLKSGYFTKVRIDGVTHFTHPGEVYKVRSYFDKTFQVQTTWGGVHFNSVFEPAIGEINTFIGGGWLTKPPDDGWNAIFNAAGYTK